MPTGTPAPTTIAYTPEAIRNAIRRGTSVPEGMLQEALQKTYAKLNATETKFFSHQGLVVDKKDVEAHTIQLKAAELILQMSDLLSRGQVKPAEPKVTLTIDAKTGTMRLVIGDEVAEEPAMLTEPEGGGSPRRFDEPKSNVLEVATEDVSDEAFEMEHIKVPKGTLPAELRQALFGPEVGT